MNYKLSKNEYILLRAIFNPELHNAIVNAEYLPIYKHLAENPAEYDHLTELDINYITAEYIKRLNTDNFKWAL